MTNVIQHAGAVDRVNMLDYRFTGRRECLSMSFAMEAGAMTILVEEFERRGYVLLRSAVRRKTVDLLHDYTIRYATSGQVQCDAQVPGTPACYGDPVMDKMLEELLPAIEGVSGYSLFPSYSYFRVYKHGDVLHRHRDRPACEISLSLCLGYRGTELWPLFVEGPSGVYAAQLTPGDGLLYKGCECDHWREPFTGLSAAQVFLHYVDRQGPYKDWRFDKRPDLNRTAVKLP